MSVEGGSDRQQAGFLIIAAVFYFRCELSPLLKPFCGKKYFAKVTKSCRHFEAKKMSINIPVFNKLCYLQKRNFINLPRIV